MKIFIFLNSLAAPSKGGAERVASNLANEMIRRNHQVFIGYEKNIYGPSYPLDSKIRHYACKRRDATSYYKDVLDNLSPDVFHVFYYNRLLLNLFKVINETNIPFTIQECTIPERLIKNNWRLGKNISVSIAAWEREIISSRACRIRATHEEFQKTYPSYLVPQIIPFPNPIEKNIQFGEESNINSDSKRIIFISGAKPHKNLLYLLKVFAKFHDDYPNWFIDVFGSIPSNSAYLNILYEFIDKHKIGNKVIFHGNTDDILCKFQKSNIHVICSLEENFSLTTLEAMSAGIPTVGYKCCLGVRKLISHEYSGILLNDINDEFEFASALIRLMNDKDYREKLGNNAIVESKKYDFDMIHDKWENLFTQAANYKGNDDKLLKEQMSIDYERSLHATRMRSLLMNRS